MNLSPARNGDQIKLVPFNSMNVEPNKATSKLWDQKTFVVTNKPTVFNNDPIKVDPSNSLNGKSNKNPMSKVRYQKSFNITNVHTSFHGDPLKVTPSNLMNGEPNNHANLKKGDRILVAQTNKCNGF